MTKQVLIKEIPEGTSFEGIVYVVSARTATGKTGKEYLTGLIADKSGEVDIKAWDNFGKFLSIVKKGSFLNIKAKVSSFQGKKQFTLQSAQVVQKEDVPIENFKQEIPSNQKQIFTEIQTILSSLNKNYWKEFVDKIFEIEEVKDRFMIYPAAKSVHHSGPCGLMIHCLSILKTLNFMCDHYKHYPLNRDLVLLGGLLHDIGKVFELNYDFRTEYTLSGKLLGHIHLGLELMETVFQKVPSIPENEKIQLKHIIISHHGSLEFGSAKLPSTLEAFLVHHVDLLDSKMETFSDHWQDQGTNEDGWTNFNRFLDRNLYLPTKDESFFAKNSISTTETKLGDVLKKAFNEISDTKN